MAPTSAESAHLLITRAHPKSIPSSLGRKRSSEPWVGLVLTLTHYSCAPGAASTRVAPLQEKGEGLGLKVEDLGFRVKGLGFRVWGLGFGVEG